jgi:hypothetical protein
MSNKRLVKMIREGKIPNRGGVFIDAYNQSINEDIAMTITTRTNTSNHYYVTDEYRQDDMPKQQGERQATFHLAKSL